MKTVRGGRFDQRFETKFEEGTFEKGGLQFCSFEGLKDGISVSSHSGNLCFYPTQVATSPLIYHHSIQYQVMSQAKELKSSLTNNTQNLYC